jgi:hypothetical protein
MITAWKIVINKITVFQDISVLACYDYLTREGMGAKYKPVAVLGADDEEYKELMVKMRDKP